jgi:hypothetical protein
MSQRQHAAPRVSANALDVYAAPTVAPMKRFGCIILLLIASCPVHAAIRQFSLRTTERLGRELYEQTQHPQALTEPQERAKRAAMDALHQLDKSYRFVVLNDLDGSGYLVYALATSRSSTDIVVGLHYRVSVSADGKAERVDGLARSPLAIPENDTSHLPAGTHQVGFYCTCMVSTQPVETLVYVTLLHKQPCGVATSDGTFWWIENGKITKDQKKR